MDETDLEADRLISAWQRYDWRESFFAPNMTILQAIVRGGKTASGIGRSRQSALMRCLGETAEILALNAAVDLDWNPLRDGIAAHLSDESAQRAAMLEAFERFAVLEWWRGGRAAMPVSYQWLLESGIHEVLNHLRSGAALRRKTGFWQVDTDPSQPLVMICQSTSAEGQDPLLGFGCDTNPHAAATKALRELLLMEMNLMEVMALRGTDQSAPLPGLQGKMATFARRCPSLLPAGPDVTPEQPDGSDRLAIGIDMELLDLTPDGGPMRVWRCRPDLPSPGLDSETNWPFL